MQEFEHYLIIKHNVIFILIGLDGQRIIMFGGFYDQTPGSLDATLYVLDLTNYSWSIPKISGKIPNSRIW